MKATLIDKMGSDLTVVNAARVSFAKKSEFDKIDCGHEDCGPECAGSFERLSEGDKKLIGYLAKNNHWTPFGHCQAQFHIKAPIFVARQAVKHQVGLVWNEVSRRYVDDTPEFWFPKEWRKRPDKSVKQGSGEDFDSAQAYLIDGVCRDLCETAARAYKAWIDAGVAPEMARIVLPANLYTEWYWTGSLAAWARVCKLRLDPHAQKEIRDLAQEINDQMAKAFPVSWAALMDGYKD